MRKMCGVLSFVSGLGLVGCAGSFQYTPRTLSTVKWEASTVALVLQDQRAAASTQLPHVPVITAGGGQEADMKLPPEFTEFIQWRLSQMLTRRGPRVRLVVMPENVRAGWHATMWSETDEANVTIRFRVTTEDGSRVLFEAVGEGHKEFSSGDASDEELAQIFRAACNDAFDAVFGSAAGLQQMNEAAAHAATSGQ